MLNTTHWKINEILDIITIIIIIAIYIADKY